MKVMDYQGERYLMAAGFMARDGRMHCAAMSEEKTFTLVLSMEAWNALEFHWFEDQGPAERRQDKWVPGEG